MAICRGLFEPLNKFIAWGDVTKELMDAHKEVANMKVANSHLWKENSRLQKELDYYKEIAAVQTAAQGPVQPRFGLNQMVVNQIQVMLDSLDPGNPNPFESCGQSEASLMYVDPNSSIAFTQSLTGPPPAVPAALQTGYFGSGKGTTKNQSYNDRVPKSMCLNIGERNGIRGGGK